MSIFRKTLCFILSAVFAFSVLFTTAGSSAAAYPEDIPIIYIHGEGSSVGVYAEDGSFHRVDNMSIDTDKLTALLSENKDVLLKAFATQDWTDFCDLLAGFMTDSFGESALGKDGMPKDGSVAELVYDENRVGAQSAGENLERFGFDYDWRLDPTDNMERLHNYAEMVMKVTGCDKYAIVGRCEGACLAVTYWETYHDPRLTDIVLYASALKGAIPVGEAFSGSMYIDPECVERFVYEADLNLNVKITESLTLTDQLLNSILKFTSDIYGLDYACWAVNNVYQQIYNKVTPKALKDTFATFPGFWAMCEDQYYEKAKEVLFGGEEEEYAGLIAKIDNYHYNIMNRAEEILKDAENSGVDVSNVVKYGLQSYPLSKDSMILSDQMCRVDYAGLGTTCTRVDEKLSGDYVNKAFENGTVRYISPDLTIDASTTPFRDTTWYIKNLEHQNFTEAVDCLFFEIVSTPGMTVNTSPDYPQFLFFNNETQELLKLNSEEHKTQSDQYNEEMEGDLARFMKPLFSFLFRIVTLLTKIFTLPSRA